MITSLIRFALQTAHIGGKRACTLSSRVVEVKHAVRSDCLKTRGRVEQFAVRQTARVHKVSRCCAATSKAAVRSGVSPAARASRAAAASSRAGVIWVVRGPGVITIGRLLGMITPFIILY